MIEDGPNEAIDSQLWQSINEIKTISQAFDKMLELFEIIEEIDFTNKNSVWLLSHQLTVYHNYFTANLRSFENDIKGPLTNLPLPDAYISKIFEFLKRGNLFFYSINKLSKYDYSGYGIIVELTNFITVARELLENPFLIQYHDQLNLKSLIDKNKQNFNEIINLCNNDEFKRINLTFSEYNLDLSNIEYLHNSFLNKEFKIEKIYSNYLEAKEFYTYKTISENDLYKAISEHKTFYDYAILNRYSLNFWGLIAFLNVKKYGVDTQVGEIHYQCKDLKFKFRLNANQLYYIPFYNQQLADLFYNNPVKVIMSFQTKFPQIYPIRQFVLHSHKKDRYEYFLKTEIVKSLMLNPPNVIFSEISDDLKDIFDFTVDSLKSVDVQRMFLFLLAYDLFKDMGNLDSKDLLRDILLYLAARMESKNK